MKRQSIHWKAQDAEEASKPQEGMADAEGGAESNSDQSSRRLSNDGCAALDALPPVLKVRDVERLCRLGRNHTFDLIRQGVIPSVRFGRSIRILKSELLKLLEGNTSECNATDMSPQSVHERERP